MCVIIDRDPKADIPLESLRTACDINKHGYGLAYVEKGVFVIHRSTQVPNNPEAIHKLLEKYKDRRVFLHLRHATVGEVSMKNSHPFVVKHSSGLGALFMHNGTLSDWSPAKGAAESDSHVFFRDWVSPWFLRTVDSSLYASKKGKVTKSPLEDDLFVDVVDQHTGYSSVFLMADTRGNVVRFNEDRGKQFKGWWASNDYSFNTNHQRSSTRASTNAGGYHYYYGSAETTSRQNASTAANLPTVIPKTPTVVPFASVFEQLEHLSARPEAGEEKGYDAVAAAVKTAKDHLSNKRGYTPMSTTLSVTATTRQSFLSRTNLTSLGDLTALCEDDFSELCKTHPETMAHLFCDLVSQLRETQVMSSTLALPQV